MQTLPGETETEAAHAVAVMAIQRRNTQQETVEAAIQMITNPEQRNRVAEQFGLYVEYGVDCHRALDAGRHAALLERRKLLDDSRDLLEAVRS